MYVVGTDLIFDNCSDLHFIGGLYLIINLFFQFHNRRQGGGRPGVQGGVDGGD